MFNYSDEDYLGLIHLQKAIVNTAKQKITYYWDGGKIQTLVIADASEFSDKSDAITNAFVQIDGIWYNPARIGIVRANNLNLWVQFLGGKVFDKVYDDATGPQAVVDAIESSFVEIDGKWYNGSQLHVARTNKATLTVQYDWLGNNQITVVYADSSAFDEAIEKIKAVGEGTGGGGGGGGGGSRTATPTFSVKPGPVDPGTKFTISCATAGATIHYTTDGTDATLDSPVYTPGTEITVPDSGITVKAVAVVLGLATSKQAVGVYTKYIGPAKRYAGWYIGTVSPASLTADDITGLNGLYTDELKTAGSPDPFSFVITQQVYDNSGCVTWAYPAEYGEVSKFKDGLGEHDITDSYKKLSVTINDVEYNVYIMIDGTTGEIGEELPQVFIAAQ